MHLDGEGADGEEWDWGVGEARESRWELLRGEGADVAGVEVDEGDSATVRIARNAARAQTSDDFGAFRSPCVGGLGVLAVVSRLARLGAAACALR